MTRNCWVILGIILIIHVCCPAWVGAQPADSLTTRLLAYADSAKRLRDTNRDTEAFALLRAALHNARHQSSKRGLVSLYFQLGLSERKRNQYEAGTLALLQANRLARQLNDTVQLFRVGYALGMVYNDQGLYTESARHCHATFGYCTPAYPKNDSLRVSIMLASIYRNMGNKALYQQYLDLAIHLGRRSKNLLEQLFAEFQQGTRWEEEGKYQAALNTRQHAMQLIRRLPTADQAEYMTNNLTGLARMYRKLRQWQPAENALKEALQWELRYRSVATQALVYTELAYLQADQGRQQAALQTGAQALLLARKTNRPDLVQPALEGLLQLQKKYGRFEDALSTTQELHKLTDSLATVAKMKAVAQVEARYKVAAKEGTIQLLRQEARIKQLEAETRQRELATVRRQQYGFIGLTIVLLTGLGVIGYLFFRTRRLQRQAEEQGQLLAMQADELQQINATKDRLFAIIGHDLRSPVTNLQFALGELALYATHTPAQASLMGQVSDQIGHLGRLINNLLYWSLAQQGMLRDRMEWLCPDSLLSDCQTLFADRIQRRKLTIATVETADEIWADEVQMQIIIRNLFDNATKFSPVGSTIFVNWERSGATYSVTFINTVDESHSAAAGSNLGLNVVDELVKRHNGSMTAQILPDKQWQTRIVWPLLNEELLRKTTIVEMA
ncbi:hypothetical protein F5984_23550 [Rudanella paleaurantiibacter]|uniref:histidine kinase n=1 Tax=Rudanella paleaurantiibacter TaxID=2614655 RepID=A0A7J5TVE7_9BACT|nr:hypothetical protein [Rudanella paleaurantiibacter]KAB7726888.1 hypothetical protein F5984_23550 [Rudanella paleaurantiibacter]